MWKRYAAAAAGLGVLAVVGKALMERQRIWTVAHGKHGYTLNLQNAPTWAILVEDGLLVLPCTCHLPGWMWKVGLRRFGVYDDGDPIHSIGSLGYDLCNMRSSVVWRAENQVAHVPLSREEAAAIDPGWVAECDRIFDDVDDLDPDATGPDSMTQKF